MPNCVKCNKPMDADSWFRAPTGELVHTECYERLQAELAGLNEQQMSDQQKMFEKIRGLLRKAESTTFEQEANTFFAKAQELMLRYRIDEEALWKLDPERRANIDQIFITLRDRDSGVMHKR